jgi:prepilin-type N-terminal cleavage/methylation domain-containing protein
MKRKVHTGFTLIELLVVIAIITLLSAVVFTSLAAARQKSRDASRIATTRSLRLALALYEDNHGSVAGINGLPIGSGAHMQVTSATTSQSIIDILVTEGVLSRKVASDVVYGNTTYYLGICSDGRYDVFTKVERTESAQASSTLSNACGGSQAIAAGYNLAFGAGAGGNGVTASSTGGGGGGGAPILSISASDDTTHLLKADGTLWVYGSNRYGQLATTTGSGGGSSYPTPRKLAGTWASAKTNSRHSLAIKPDGTLWSWGVNHRGQLGNGTKDPDATTPHPTPSQIGTATWSSVFVGNDTSFALKSDGSLYAWGVNYFGQVGNTTNNTNYNGVSTPTQIPGTWKTIATGLEYTLGIKSDGTLWAWGRNQSGQLATSTTAMGGDVPHPTPIQIGTSTWTNIAAANYTSYGIKSDGTLWAWGANAQGQLGNGTSAGGSFPTPSQIPGSWTSITAGSDQALGIKSDGTLWAWGRNYFGQLGNATNVGTNNGNGTPTQIAGNWIDAAGGVNYSVGIKSDGTVWGFGYNYYGQQGNTTSNQTGTANTSPIQIPGFVAN